MFNNIYKNKKIFVTGHTGFKGSWLCSWLLELGAEVYGYSIDIPTSPAMFVTNNLESKLNHTIADVRDLETLKNQISSIKPDFIFHLAAQPIVSESFSDPITTISTNVLGTANILESLRELEHDCAAVIITSDKCYFNKEWVWGYRETDALGGKDVYSASKAAAENIFTCYSHSFFSKKSNVKVATARAGNVIGGGDWAKDRIVADCYRAWSEDKVLTIRRPNATRPWQHVLEPLSGYLLLAANLYQGKSNLEQYNFGPSADQNYTVLNLITKLSELWDHKNIDDAVRLENKSNFDECGLLKLSCDKALSHLSWKPTLVYDETISFVNSWYFNFYKQKNDMQKFTSEQINHYCELAKLREIKWTN